MNHYKLTLQYSMIIFSYISLTLNNFGTFDKIKNLLHFELIQIFFTRSVKMFLLNVALG